MKKYLTIEEVAEILRVTTRTVSTWIKKKGLPCIRIEQISGSPKRFIEDDVRNWFESKKDTKENVKG